MDTLAVLSALAQIGDIQSFRLRDFMHQLGMDERQPAQFYRELIKEAREVNHLIDQQQERLAISEEAKSETEAELSLKDQEVKSLRAGINTLEHESEQRANNLESENRRLKGIASQLEEKAMNYEAVKEFLKGKKDTNSVRATFYLFSEILNEMLEAKIGLRPPPDPRRLAEIRPQLRDDLTDVLEIPTDALEEKLWQARKVIEALEEALSIATGGRYRGLFKNVV